jgi:hypothetical protein
MRFVPKNTVVALMTGLASAVVIATACGGSGDNSDNIDPNQGGGGSTADASTNQDSSVGGSSGMSGTAGSNTAGSGTSGTSTAGSATAGSSTAGTAGSTAGGSAGNSAGTAGSGTAGSGTAGSSTAGSSTAGSGTAGTMDGGLDPDAACVALESTATLKKKPVDIIIAIDNSGSMSGEIKEVQNQINQNFADIIEASGIDFQVIMVTRHGNVDSGNESVCISGPLSGTTCSPVPTQPAETTRFHHINVEISSYNALCRLIKMYNSPDNEYDNYTLHPQGYGPLLRPDALKTFMVITDDRVDNGQQNGCTSPIFDDQNSIQGGQTAATQWENALLALSPTQFGTKSNRNYIFHSIVALAPFDANDLTKAHPPSAPVITAKCTPGSQNPGTGYQSLSKLTGGLRYPTCGLDYSTIFNQIAQGVIQGAKVECDFPIPDPPMGQTIDPNTIQLQYTPGGGAPTIYSQVTTANDCTPQSFYITNNTVHLCPAVCTAVQADNAAKIDILFGCGKI